MPTPKKLAKPAHAPAKTPTIKAAVKPAVSKAVKAAKPAPGSALTPQARAAVDGFIAAIQRNPAAALVAFGALALGVLLIFG